MALTKKTEGLKLLNPENIKITIDDQQEVTLELKDRNKIYKDVEINPAFPLSQIGHYLSLKYYEGDGNNNEDKVEIGMIKDINNLDRKSRKAVEQALEKIYFMPKITRIYEIEEEFGVTRWEVETEKGRRSFDIKSRRKDVRPHGHGRIVIHDIDGNRYEIPDIEKLDEESYTILRSEI